MTPPFCVLCWWHLNCKTHYFSPQKSDLVILLKINVNPSSPCQLGAHTVMKSDVYPHFRCYELLTLQRKLVLCFSPRGTFIINSEQLRASVDKKLRFSFNILIENMILEET